MYHEHLFNSKWLNVFRTEDGYYFASRKVAPEIDKKVDSVFAACQTSEGKILVVRQFRQAVDDFIYDLPAGLVEANETPEDAAKREVFEETGHKITSISARTHQFYNSAGLTDESSVIIYCDVGPQESKPELETLYMSTDDLMNLYESGKKISTHLMAIINLLIGWQK